MGQRICACIICAYIILPNIGKHLCIIIAYFYTFNINMRMPDSPVLPTVCCQIFRVLPI